MRKELETTFESMPDPIALLAVYGPEHGEMLYEEYDIGGAPTTLFAKNSTIDSRTVGAQFKEIIEEEIGLLRES